MQLLRTLFFMSAHFKFTLRAKHIPGSQNSAADAISRGDASLFYSLMTGSTASHAGTPGSSRPVGNSQPRLDLAELEDSVSFYYAHGLATSTLRSYKSGQDRYVKFFISYNSTPIPVTEHVLSVFVAAMAKEGLKHQTIKCYMSAIRHSFRKGFHSHTRGEHAKAGIRPARDKVTPSIGSYELQPPATDNTQPVRSGQEGLGKIPGRP